MRRGRRGPLVGRFCLWAGIIILLALILPSGFWWFALGAGLICFGIWAMRCW